jgi:hypothetical protein
MMCTRHRVCECACLSLAAIWALSLSMSHLEQGSWTNGLHKASRGSEFAQADAPSGKRGKTMRGPLPWDSLPKTMQGEFLMNGKIPLEKYYVSHDVFDGQAEPPAPWTEKMVQDLRVRAAAEQDLNGYCGAARYLRRAFSKVRVHASHAHAHASIFLMDRAC